MNNDKLPEGYDEFHTIANHLRLLSKREKQVYELLYTPMCQKEMATELFVETKTIKFHLTSIYRKCKVSGRAELLGKILQNGNKR